MSIDTFSFCVGYIASSVIAVGAVLVFGRHRDDDCQCEGLWPTQRAEAGPHHKASCVEYLWIPKSGYQSR